MTMTSDRAAGASPRGQAESAGRTPIQWTSVQRGLWVGKANGEFAGMIERRDDEGFDAHGDCQHGMVASVLAMTDRGDRLRDNRRQRSEHAEKLKDASPSWP